MVYPSSPDAQDPFRLKYCCAIQCRIFLGRTSHYFPFQWSDLWSRSRPIFPKLYALLHLSYQPLKKQKFSICGGKSRQALLVNRKVTYRYIKMQTKSMNWWGTVVNDKLANSDYVCVIYTHIWIEILTAIFYYRTSTEMCVPRSDVIFHLSSLSKAVCKKLSLKIILLCFMLML